MYCTVCGQQILPVDAYCAACGTRTGNIVRVERRLTRSFQERKIAGVCAGVGNYLGIDPAMVRFVWMISTIFYGAGLLLYLLMWIAMPLEQPAVTYGRRPLPPGPPLAPLPPAAPGEVQTT
jgi:phage shock protein PspC (stress-responsive transcriptional regulator)